MCVLCMEVVPVGGSEETGRPPGLSTPPSPLTVLICKVRVRAGQAAGLPETEAMKVANAAAGVVVGKVGTAVCSFDELTAALQV